MPGGGKQPGAGRPRGQPNLATRDLKALAHEYTAEAVLTLAEVMRDRRAPAVARVTASNSLLDRAHGKPRQQLEHSGPDDGPIRMSIEDRTRRALAVLDEAFAEPGEK